MRSVGGRIEVRPGDVQVQYLHPIWTLGLPGFPVFAVELRAGEAQDRPERF